MFESCKIQSNFFFFFFARLCIEGAFGLRHAWWPVVLAVRGLCLNIKFSELFLFHQFSSRIIDMILQLQFHIFWYRANMCSMLYRIALCGALHAISEVASGCC